MPPSAETLPRRPPLPIALSMGLTCFAIGAFLLAGAAGALPTHPVHAAAPRWVVGCIGLTLLAGAFVPINAVVALPAWLDRLDGLTVAASLAMVFHWVAFFPGERHLTASMSIPGVQLSGAASALTGRNVFGIVALCVDALVVWRQWRGQDSPAPRA